MKKTKSKFNLKELEFKFNKWLKSLTDEFISKQK